MARPSRSGAIGNNGGMRRLAGLIGLIAPLALASTAGAAAPASQTPRKTMVIVVKSITTASIPHDKAPKGASKGDSIVLRDRLVNVRRQFGKPAGATVGRDAGILSLTSASSGTFEGVAQLPGGTIRLHGVTDAGRQTFTVTGGTGKYAHARGTVIVGSGDAPLNTYRLSFPGDPVVVV